MTELPKANLRILITNNGLSQRAGTELYVRDLALGLIKLGHFPVVYSTALGKVSDELTKATVPVVSDLRALHAVPDLIHGHHHLETMTALLRFPRTPGIFVCHGWAPWEELPPRFPTILRYVAVNDLCRERLLTTEHVDPASIETIYNWVDTGRSLRSRGPLPERPQSALIFSNAASGPVIEDPVRAACARVGIELVDVVGRASGRTSHEPERLLGKYDVVFAKDRAALEALASGCSVVVADAAGLGSLVTRENVERLWRLNFGIRTMQTPLDAANVVAQLQLYDRADAALVTDYVREHAAMDIQIARWERLYSEVLAEWPGFLAEQGSELSEKQLVAATEYLAFLSPVVKSAKRQPTGRELVAALAAKVRKRALGT